MNDNGGVYYNGRSYSVEKKWTVALVYNKLKQRHDRVSTRMMARHSGVSPTFASKVIAEVESGEILDPKDIEKARKKKNKGPGSRSLSAVDKAILLTLRRENP